MEEFTTCARVCKDCLRLLGLCDQRTRKVQALSGTITVDAPRIGERAPAGMYGDSWMSYAVVAPGEPTALRPSVQRYWAAASNQQLISGWPSDRPEFFHRPCESGV